MLRQLFAILFLILLLPIPASANTIVLSTGEDQSNNRSAYLNALIRECFDRMGMDLDIKFTPHKRALEAARLGLTDGTFVRTELVAKACPDLIMVPVPLIAIRVTVFATDPTVLDGITGWESLAPYRVAFINGWLWAERHLPACKEIHRINNKGSLLLFLKEERADVAIFAEGLGKEEINTRKLDTIHILTTPLSITRMYLYLNRRHADMVGEIAQTLTQMERDGTCRAFLLEHFGH